MRDYKKITILGNIDRQSKLSEFRNLAIEYFSNVTSDFIGVRENQEAMKVRPSINFKIQKVHSIILASRINPILIHSPPPAIGGRIQNLDLIENIFLLHSYDVEPNYLFDFIDRSIGIYNDDAISSLLRTINPFFWVSLIFAYVVSLPFKLLGELGFNQSKIESSVMGRGVKVLLYLITLIASLYTILPPMIKSGYFDIILK